MSTSNKPYEDADIRLGEVTWSKSTPAAEEANQQKHLLELANIAETGVILDCAFITVANSELLNLLVRVRTQAKKQEKGFVIFNVPDNLLKTINVCKLGPVLPIAGNMDEARKLAYDQSCGKGLKQKLKRFLKRES